MTFTTNSLGCRGPEPQRFPTNGILFIGDSFTEGYGVNDGEEFPALVRKSMDERFGKEVIPVVNAGMGNIGLGRWINFLRNEAKRYAPRLVVIEVMDNDFFDDLQERLVIHAGGDSLIELEPAPPSKSRLLQGLFESIPGLSYSFLFGLVRQAFSTPQNAAGIPQTNEELASSDQLTYGIVETLLRICERNKWKTLVLLVGLEGRRHDAMQAVIRRHQMQVITTPTLRERPELFYTIDGHWNAKGHQFVANQVLDAITASAIQLQ